MATIKRLKLKELREDYKIDRGELAGFLFIFVLGNILNQ